MSSQITETNAIWYARFVRKVITADHGYDPKTKWAPSADDMRRLALIVGGVDDARSMREAESHLLGLRFKNDRRHETFQYAQCDRCMAGEPTERDEWLDYRYPPQPSATVSR